MSGDLHVKTNLAQGQYDEFLPPALLQEAVESIKHAYSLEKLEQLRIEYLGKKGIITNLLRQLGELPVEQKKAAGQHINMAKKTVQDAVAQRRIELQQKLLEQKLASETIDITLPPRPEPKGKIHPISHVIEEISLIFAEMGFVIVEGPEIEDDFHNFTALNFPPEHPARQMHDTFFLHGKHDAATTKSTEKRALLRTHTSPVQIRALQNNSLPLRCIAPGKTYRCDSDQTHTPMFHQIEALAVDKDITMSHLKGTVIEFLKVFFEIDNLPVRFRPSYFPFTEPSAEVDIGCKKADGKLTIGGSDDWLEIMGCGMVHPNVLLNCGIDPQKWQGFALGMGVERMAMLKYGISDLRTFFESDVRWLKHYGFGGV